MMVTSSWKTYESYESDLAVKEVCSKRWVSLPAESLTELQSALSDTFVNGGSAGGVADRVSWSPIISPGQHPED